MFTNFGRVLIYTANPRLYIKEWKELRQQETED